MKKKKILFVCKANHFRSTVAEQILKNLRKDLIVRSAGLQVKKPHRPSRNAWRNADNSGIKIRWHLCRQFDKKMSEYFDKIYVFEKVHKKFIEDKFPNSKGKVFVIHTHEDLKGKSDEAHKKFIKDMRIILKKFAKEL